MNIEPLFVGFVIVSYLALIATAIDYWKMRK